MNKEEKKIVLSEDQDKAVSQILEWQKGVSALVEEATEIDNPLFKRKQILTLGGYAGTGKTTVLSHIRHGIGNDFSVAFLSFTGKATSVMKRKLLESGAYNPGRDHISTIHSYMYRPVLDSKGNITGWTRKPMMEGGFNLVNDEQSSVFNYAPPVDLFVIDEASMPPDELISDLKKYGKPILAVGDHGQLPPVKGVSSLMKNPDVRLEKIHRQAEDNPILIWAHMAREGKHIPMSTPTEKIMKAHRSAFGGSSIEATIVCKPSPDNMVLVATNSFRAEVNTAVLKHLRDQQMIESKPRVGERVICLKNNHQLGIYNGMTGEIIEERPCYESPQHNWHFLFKPDEDLDRVIPITMNKYTFLSEYGKIPDEVNFREVKERFDFGYCLTVHKAQGSEAKRVVIIGEGFGSPEMKRRWLYTAITRAKEELYIFV